MNEWVNVWIDGRMEVWLGRSVRVAVFPLRFAQSSRQLHPRVTDPSTSRMKQTNTTGLGTSFGCFVSDADQVKSIALASLKAHFR